MAIRPFNSVAGISVGDPSTPVILANADVTPVNLTVSGVSDLGPISNVYITGGTSGQVLSTDGAGNLSFIDSSSGNSAAPMPYIIPVGESYLVPENFQGLFTVPITIDGTFEVDGILAEVGTAINSQNSQIIFDDNGELTGNTGFTFDQTSGNLSVPGSGLFTGDLLPSANITYDLGSPTQRWRDLYLSNNTIYLGTSTISGANGNIALTNAGGGEFVVAGNATVSTLENGNSNISINANANITVSINGTSNVVVFSDDAVNVSANLIATGVKTDNYYYANGQPLDTGGNPGGSNTQVQFNNNGEFGGTSAFTFDSATSLLSVTGNIAAGNISITGSFSSAYLTSSAGCVTIGGGAIAVNGTDAGIFNASVSNINLGLVANVTIGSTTGLVTVRNNLNVTGNVVSNNSSANSIQVGDLYSKRPAIAVTTDTVIDSFSLSEYRSAKYTIKVSDDTGYQALEVLLVHDNINSIITVYGSLSMTGYDLIALTTDINGSNVELLATGLNGNTSVNLLGTYVPD